VLAALSAVFLAAALVLETAVRGHLPLGRAFAAAGLVFLVLAVLAPYQPGPPSLRRRVLSDTPHFGKTRAGLHVHLRTIDHLPGGSAYARFNKRVATALTAGVGTMTTFWLFCLLALCSLPAVLSGFSVFAHAFPAVIIKASIIALVAWVAQTLIQLVLLPALMVGQSLQNEASDARAAKTFEDIEAVRTDLITALDRLDVSTEGGIKAVLDAVTALAAQQPQAAVVNMSMPDAQVKQIVTAVQASLLEQARRNPGPGLGRTRT
jgi:hypothetical protein